MTLREKQDNFCLDFQNMGYELLTEYNNQLPAEPAASLSSYKIVNCKSRTYFCAKNESGIIRISGWSQSAIVGGMIAAIVEMFDGISISEFQSTVIDFHNKSGLINSLTPLRQDALTEMIHRIFKVFY